jgi:hypothetical protein
MAQPTHLWGGREGETDREKELGERGRIERKRWERWEREGDR